MHHSKFADTMDFFARVQPVSRCFVSTNRRTCVYIPDPTFSRPQIRWRLLDARLSRRAIGYEKAFLCSGIRPLRFDGILLGHTQTAALDRAFELFDLLECRGR